MLLLFFFTDTAPPEFYTLSLHDALPISGRRCRAARARGWCARKSGWRRHACARRREYRRWCRRRSLRATACARDARRSEEHTSELQSLRHLVCRLLLEKKKQKNNQTDTN